MGSYWCNSCPMHTDSGSILVIRRARYDRASRGLKMKKEISFKEFLESKETQDAK